MRNRYGIYYLIHNLHLVVLPLNVQNKKYWADNNLLIVRTKYVLM